MMRSPETREEVAEAIRLAADAISEEPWERWWQAAARSGGEALDEKGRPFLVVSDAANAAMQRVLVAPVTRRVRGLPSELLLGAAEGLPVQSAASFDNLRPFPKAMLVRRLGALGPRKREICRVAGAALDC